MSERDVAKPLPVLDGPCKGQRIASPGHEFTFVVARPINKTHVQYRYCLRRHRLIGLVWALPENKSVSPILE